MDTLLPSHSQTFFKFFQFVPVSFLAKRLSAESLFHRSMFIVKKISILIPVSKYYSPLERDFDSMHCIWLSCHFAFSLKHFLNLPLTFKTLTLRKSPGKAGFMGV